MGYCAPRGIPHSVFLGWRRRDRELALWWLIHERQRCPSCGTRPEEWDPEQGGDMHAYHATGRHCRGCEVLAPEQDRLQKALAAREARRGTTITLRPSPPPQQHDEQPEEVADGGDDGGPHR